MSLFFRLAAAHLFQYILQNRWISTTLKLRGIGVTNVPKWLTIVPKGGLNSPKIAQMYFGEAVGWALKYPLLPGLLVVKAYK
jgi:hypothetical protein